MLLADDNKKPRLSLSEAVEGLFIGKCRADEHEIIKLAAKGAAELVHEELRLS